MDDSDPWLTYSTEEGQHSHHHDGSTPGSHAGDAGSKSCCGGTEDEIKDRRRLNATESMLSESES
eukprot:3149409-Rhodomonas_salina.1